MMIVILHQEVPANPSTSKEGEVQRSVREVLHRVNMMAMLQMSEELKEQFKKTTLQSKLKAQQDNRLLGLIRIQIEEIKGKVRALSPAALQFIGPGD